MIDGWMGAAAGAAAGLLIGGLTHGLLAAVRNDTDKIFYGVWAAGMLARLVFVAAAFFYLAKHPQWPMVPTMVGLLAGQFSVQMIPIRSRRSSGTLAGRENSATTLGSDPDRHPKAGDGRGRTP